jgi:hypothetical protein
VGDRLPGDLADVHPMLKPSTIVSTASPPLGLRPTGVPTVDTARPRSYIDPLSRICGTGPPLTSPGTHETFNATVHGRDQEQEASDIAGDGLIIHSSAEKVFQGLRGTGQTAPAESEPTTAAISSESQVVTPQSSA